MIVHLGLSNGVTYFLHDKMENPPRGLVDLESYRVPQWCSFEEDKRDAWIVPEDVRE